MAHQRALLLTLTLTLTLTPTPTSGAPARAAPDPHPDPNPNPNPNQWRTSARCSAASKGVSTRALAAIRGDIGEM